MAFQNWLMSVFVEMKRAATMNTAGVTGYPQVL